MFWILAVVLIIISLVLHEAGHAIAMRKCGVEIKEIGLGIPVPYIPYLSFKIGSINYCFHPLVIGAYVKPTDEGNKFFEELPYKDFSFIVGAGVYANLVFAFMLFIFGALIAGAPISRVIQWPPFLICVGILIALLFTGKFFCRYLVLVTGIVMVGVVAWTIFHDPGKAVVGPVGLVKTVGAFSTSAYMAVIIAGSISLALGLCNALPFYPLDGGLLVMCLLKKKPKVLAAFKSVTLGFFIALIVFALFSDYFNFLR